MSLLLPSLDQGFNLYQVHFLEICVKIGLQVFQNVEHQFFVLFRQTHKVKIERFGDVFTESVSVFLKNEETLDRQVVSLSQTLKVVSV